MDTTAIEYFLKIACGNTYWEVSEEYNISQSSVSKAISRMENELGVKLFDRQKRYVTLTPAGKIFYQGLSKLYPDFQNLLKELASYSTKKTICCAFVPNSDLLDLDLWLPESPFLKQHPDIQLNLSNQRDIMLGIQALQESRLDFLIGHRFLGMDKYCDSITLYQDPLYVIMPRDHPLATQESVDFRDLYNEPIISSAVIIKEVINEICQFLNLPSPPNLTFYDVPYGTLKRNQIIAKVTYGHGITFFFKSDIKPFNLQSVHACPVTNCPEFPIVLAKKKGRKLTPYQELFQKEIWEHAMTL